MNRHLKTIGLREKLTSLALLGLVFQAFGVPALMAQQAPTATIQLKNTRAVSVNGQRAASGNMIQSGNRIETQSGAEAEVTIGGVGTLKVYSNTVVSLTFEMNRADARVEKGCATLFIEPGSTGSLTLPSGEVRQIEGVDGGSEESSCRKTRPGVVPVGSVGLPFPAMVVALAAGGVVAGAIVHNILTGSPSRP